MKPFFSFIMLFVLASVTLASSAAGASVNPVRDMLIAGRVDEAISSLNGKLTSTPNDAESQNLLCRAYFALDQWDRAESACKKAVELDPSKSEFHLWLGRVYGEKADHVNFMSAAGLAGKTRDEFQRAVELAPNDVDARTDLAEFYIEAPGIVGGGRDKARAQAKAISQLSPAREHWIYARIAEKEKDASAAEREYRQMIEAGHGDSEGWLNLAFFYKHQKRFDEMEQSMVKASEAPTSNPEVLVDIADTLFHTNRNLPLGVQCLERYLTTRTIERAPAFKAHYLLGSIFEKQGDRASAAKHYQESLKLARSFGPAQQALNRVNK
jgi:cytochrome c-type biogenesis protein CcmH/NrfG